MDEGRLALLMRGSSMSLFHYRTDEEARAGFERSKKDLPETWKLYLVRIVDEFEGDK